MTSVTGSSSAFLGVLGQSGTASRTATAAAEEEYQNLLDRMAQLTEGRDARKTADSAALQVRSGQASMEFLVQQIAQQTDGATGAEAAPAVAEDTPSSAEQAFLDYMSKTPEERYFDAFLKSKGMTQEEFDALAPEEKQALMQEFQETIKQRVENDSAEKLAKAAGSDWF